MTVLRAGLTGLIASSFLGNSLESIVDESGGPPGSYTNHLLRFPNDSLESALNIPLDRVLCAREIYEGHGSKFGTDCEGLADACLSYAWKTTGKMTLDRSICDLAGVGGREIVDRWIYRANNLHKELGDRLGPKVHYKKQYTDYIPESKGFSSAVISTLPMPQLMALLEYPHRLEFQSLEGMMVTFKLPGMWAFGSIYLPNRSTPFSRIGLQGDKVILEAYNNGKIDSGGIETEWWESGADIISATALSCLFEVFPNSVARQLIEDKARDKFVVNRIPHAKILPINERERQRFIMWATDNFGIYSMGRLAIWRPGLLLTDLVRDFRVIWNMMLRYGGSNEEYNQRTKFGGERK